MESPDRDREERPRAGRAASRGCKGATAMGTPAPRSTGPVTGPESPAEPVPVAILARTSTLAMQDPVASLNRQIRSCRQWLPAGWYVAGYYWDIESGGIDLEQRSQGDAWQQFTAAGLP